MHLWIIVLCQGTAKDCCLLREGEPGAESDPRGGNVLTDPVPVLQGLTMVSEPGAGNRVRQRPQTRQEINWIQSPSREPSQG